MVNNKNLMLNKNKESIKVFNLNRDEESLLLEEMMNDPDYSVEIKETNWDVAGQYRVAVMIRKRIKQEPKKEVKTERK